MQLKTPLYVELFFCFLTKIISLVLLFNIYIMTSHYGNQKDVNRFQIDSIMYMNITIQSN